LHIEEEEEKKKEEEKEKEEREEKEFSYQIVLKMPEFRYMAETLTSQNNIKE
jgi:hypothetical protein